MSEPDQPAATEATDPSAPKDASAAGSTDDGVSPESPEGVQGAESLEDDEAEAEDGEDVFDEFGTPFTPKTFGGAFVWAKGEHFIATVLRIKEGKSVPVATTNRQDMHVMLTGGRAVLEVDDGTEVDRIELVPAGPLYIDPARRYRLIAMTEVEIFTVYTQR